MDIKMHKHITHKLEQERVRLNNKLNQIYEYAHQMEGKWHDAVKERNQYKAERDTLIDDIKKLRERNKQLEENNEQLNEIFNYQENKKKEYFNEIVKLEKENKALRLQANTYFDEWQNVKNLYTTLTNHIRLKAENNPGVSRYIDLVNYIDRLERGEDLRDSSYNS
ncbi:hypothetical protein NGB00_02050 [Staphylococcus pseudoxylosus]|nr:hypothetical protein [Staphylococcus pseudoxylosus]MEB7752545.1 hypothetical protein [Staphylococcus pseudoxylosus]